MHACISGCLGVSVAPACVAWGKGPCFDFGTLLQTFKTFRLLVLLATAAVSQHPRPQQPHPARDHGKQCPAHKHQTKTAGTAHTRGPARSKEAPVGRPICVCGAPLPVPCVCAWAMLERLPLPGLHMFVHHVTDNCSRLCWEAMQAGRHEPCLSVTDEGC
jgi:hypothetical protein